jgi:pimeloyl-ACP methyl ester carboxylesterase
LLALCAGCVHFQRGPSQTIPADERMVVRGRGQVHVIDLNPTAAEAVILVHGYGASLHSYLPILPELAKHFRVIALDLPGFGLSDRLPGDYSPKGLADVLVNVLDQKHIARASVVGNSWGASIALAFAIHHRHRLHKLIIVSGFVYDEQIPGLMRWARVRGLGEGLYATFYRQAIGEKLYLNFHDPSYVTQRAVDGVETLMNIEGSVAVALAAARGMGTFAAQETKYPDIDAESLLLWGSEDRVTRLEFGKRLAKELHGRLVVFPLCGHVLTWECRSETIAELQAFLGSSP